MKQRRRSFIIIGSVIVITLFIVLFFSVINKKDNHMPAVQSPDVGDVEWQPPEGEFMTHSKEPQVLWKRDQQMIYVQDLHLYYTSDGSGKEVLYGWKKPLSVQAWLNGEYLLIGTQLIEEGSQKEGHRLASAEFPYVHVCVA